MGKLSLEEIFTPTKKSNIIGALTDATIKTEGLVPGQTPLRITNDTMRGWSTIQGVPIDKEAKIPNDRRNFFFVKPGREREVIDSQYKNYFKNPEKYGLTKESTVEDAVKVFDQENPQNKLNILKKDGWDIKEKLKNFDISKLNPFKTEEAYAEERPSLDTIFGKEKSSLDTIFGKTKPSLDSIFSDKKPSLSIIPSLKFGLDRALRESIIGPFMKEQKVTDKEGLNRLQTEANIARMETSLPQVVLQTATNIASYPLEKVGQALRWVTTPIRKGVEKIPFIPEKYKKPISEVVGMISEYAAYSMVIRGTQKGVKFAKTVPGARTEQRMKQFVRDKTIAQIESRNPGISRQAAGELADIMTKGKFGKELIKQVQTLNETEAIKTTQQFVDKVLKTTEITSKNVLGKKPIKPTKPTPTTTPAPIVPPVKPEVGKTPIILEVSEKDLTALGQPLGTRGIFRTTGQGLQEAWKVGLIETKPEGITTEDKVILINKDATKRDPALGGKSKEKIIEHEQKHATFDSLEKKQQEHFDNKVNNLIKELPKDHPVNEEVNRLKRLKVKDNVIPEELFAEGYVDIEGNILKGKPPKPTKAPEVKERPSLAKIMGERPKPQLEPKLPKLKNQAQIKREAKKKAQKEAMLEVKEAGEAKDAITEHIRQRRFNLNLATYETNLFVNELDRNLTKEQREILPFLMEKTDIPEALNRPGLKKVYDKDKKTLQPTVKKVKQHFDEGWKKIQENTENFTAQQIENYVTHIWDIPRSKKSEITNWFVTQNRFLKKRYIETLKDGIEKFGLKPKVLDISEIIRVHDIITNRVIENNKFVNWLSKIKTTDGTPLLAPSHLAPPDWVAIHHPALQKKLFIPSKEKLGEKISNELQDILTEMGVAIGRRISPVSFGKPTKAGGFYVSGKPPEIRLQRFFATSTVAHEIGHHIDKVMNLGDTFLNKYKDELYTINKDRIKQHKGKVGKYGQEYAESTSEQIAEFFALLFTDAKKSMKLAPGATSEILNKLNNDAVLTKLVDLNFANRAKNLIGESAGTMISVPLKTHPDLANALKVIFDTPLRHPAITAYETANAYLKKASLTLSLFHPVALSEASIATMGIGKTLKLLSPMKIYKALAKNELPVYTDIPMAKEWIKHGLSLGATIDIPVARIQKNLNDIAAMTRNVPLVNKMTQFVSTLNKGWDKLLWNYYQSSLKLYGAEHLSRHIDPTKDATIQKREIAQLINDTYGGQNWEVLMMGPKSVQLMTWGLLSADWTVSALLRQPMAMTGAGAIHKEGIKLRRKLGSLFWLKAALYFGVGINLLNVLNRKRDYKQNPQYYEGQEPKTIWDYTMLGNTIGRKTHLFVGRYKDGTERYVRWGKQFRELPEMLFDDTEVSPISASLRKIGGKTAPVLQQVSTIMTGVSPSGYTQRDIYGKRGWDRVWGSLKSLSKAPIPFSLRNSLQADKEFNITDLAMPSSKGLTPWKTVNYFKIGIEKYQKSGDDRIVKEVYQGAVKNNLNAYGLFKSAMTILKAEKTKGINALLKDIEDVNKAIKTEKDSKVKVILYRRKASLIKNKVLREQGIKLLDVALSQLEYSK